MTPIFTCLVANMSFFLIFKFVLKQWHRNGDSQRKANCVNWCFEAKTKLIWKFEKLHILNQIYKQVAPSVREVCSYFLFTSRKFFIASSSLTQTSCTTTPVREFLYFILSFKKYQELLRPPVQTFQYFEMVSQKKV